MVHSYGHQHVIRMRLLNLESLKCRDADLSRDILHHVDRTASTVMAAAPVVHMIVMKGGCEDVSNFLDFSHILQVSLESIYCELI